jgi:hypothetical protein
MSDDTIWCEGVNERVPLDKTCQINGRTVYNGVFCDTGELVDPDGISGSTLQEIIPKLASLPPEAQERLNQAIDEYLRSGRFDDNL